jgi:hypothetical protein
MLYPKGYENKAVQPAWSHKAQKRAVVPAVDAKRQQAVDSALRRAHIKTLVSEVARDLENIQLREKARELALQLRTEEARRRGEAYFRVNG